ncbi:hypothetical protein [Gracilibacillus salinarum]|uniref:DUF4340 domain-containing protein n=1 Tax=Gracilibacillus salinarum TaxID=2932255 RepID=A0ABY4GJ84_9BACI|nr:hypothetical protein [Gracilibacillus salinarum]UOQ84415.1 hypothetical protein MUN87_17220 [Gracilibacillus salinarum]
MRKRLWIAVLTFLVLMFVAFEQLYYPAMPIDSISKKEVLDIMEHSTANIVKITEEEKADWFITETGAGSEGVFKEMLGNKGWNFQKQDGSGYFFVKDAETIIVTTQNWTGEYLLVKVPDKWAE